MNPNFRLEYTFTFSRNQHELVEFLKLKIMGWGEKLSELGVEEFDIGDIKVVNDRGKEVMEIVVIFGGCVHDAMGEEEVDKGKLKIMCDLSMFFTASMPELTRYYVESFTSEEVIGN